MKSILLKILWFFLKQEVEPYDGSTYVWRYDFLDRWDDVL